MPSNVYTLDSRGNTKSVGGALNDAYFSSRSELDEGLNQAVIGRMSPQMAYRRVPWLYRAVNIKALAVSRFPFDVLDSAGNDVKDSPGLDSLFHNFRALLYQTAVTKSIYGHAYWYLDSNALGRNLTLRFLRPQFVKPQVVAGRLTGFTYAANGNKDAQAGIPDAISLEQIVYFWAFNPESDIAPGPGDCSIVNAAASALWAIDGLIGNYFNGGGIPVTFIEAASGATPADKADFQNFLNRSASGIRNAFRYLLVRAGIKATVVGSQLKEMQAPELITTQRESVATGVGVPSALIASKNENKATAEVNHLQLYTGAVIPEFESIAEIANDQLFSRLRPPVTLVGRPEMLEVMQQVQLEKAQSVSFVVDSPPLDADEGRQLLGYAPRNAAPDSGPSAEETGGEGDLSPAVKAQAQFEQMLKALPDQRRRALLAVRQGLPMPQGPDKRINAALAGAKSATEVREVFERHWPQKAAEPMRAAEPESEMAAIGRELLAEIRLARKAIDMPMPATQPQIKFDLAHTELSLKDMPATDMQPIADAMSAGFAQQAEQMRGVVEALNSQPAPVVNAPVTVNVPETVINVAAPVINLPEMPPAQVVVNVPEQPAPTIINRPSDVTLAMPNAEKEITLTRDYNGNLTGARVTNK